MSPLGRKFDTLFDQDEIKEEAPAARAFRRIPVGEIRPNPEQPRRHFDEEELAALTESIRTHGILSPLIVRKSDGRYILIAGERRLRAAQNAGLREVPVLVREAEKPEVQLELALVENLQRSDLDPIEAARGYQRLVAEFGHTQEQVADRIGKNRATVTNAIRLLKLPESVLAEIQSGRLSPGHGKALLTVEDPEALARLVGIVIAHELSVRATEELVQRWQNGDEAAEREEKELREEEVAPGVELLEESLHTKVSIRPRRNGSGRIIIEYSSITELDRLIDYMQHPK